MVGPKVVYEFRSHQGYGKPWTMSIWIKVAYSNKSEYYGKLIKLLHTKEKARTCNKFCMNLKIDAYHKGFGKWLYAYFFPYKGIKDGIFCVCWWVWYMSALKALWSWGIWFKARVTLNVWASKCVFLEAHLAPMHKSIFQLQNMQISKHVCLF